MAKVFNKTECVALLEAAAARKQVRVARRRLVRRRAYARWAARPRVPTTDTPAPRVVFFQRRPGVGNVADPFEAQRHIETSPKARATTE